MRQRNGHLLLPEEISVAGKRPATLQQRICRCPSYVEGVELCVRRWGLAVVLALGFAADAVVLVTTRARADAARSAADAEIGRPESAKIKRLRPHRASQSDGRNRGHRERRSSPLDEGARPVGSDSWSLVMIGITLALAVCGGIIAAGRRFLPTGRGSGDASRRSREPFAQAHGLFASGRPARLARRGRAAGLTIADQRAG